MGDKTMAEYRSQSLREIGADLVRIGTRIIDVAESSRPLAPTAREMIREAYAYAALQLGLRVNREPKHRRTSFYHGTEPEPFLVMEDHDSTDWVMSGGAGGLMAHIEDALVRHMETYHGEKVQGGA